MLQEVSFMPFEIIRNDLANIHVNAANLHPMVGHCVDSGLHKKAGAQLLQPVGRNVIHAVPPVWQGGEKTKLLRSLPYKVAAAGCGTWMCVCGFPAASCGEQQFSQRSCAADCHKCLQQISDAA